MTRSVLPVRRDLAWAVALTVVVSVACVDNDESSQGSGVMTFEPGKLFVCLYSGFAPFVYLNDGEWVGWDVEFLSEFADSLGLKFTPVGIEVFGGIWKLAGDRDW